MVRVIGLRKKLSSLEKEMVMSSSVGSVRFCYSDYEGWDNLLKDFIDIML